MNQSIDRARGNKDVLLQNIIDSGGDLIVRRLF
jgi:hypothetical protein